MAERATILVADDDEILLKGLEINLKREGYEVITAGNGAEAVNLAARHKPQLAILDVLMPVMDGIEVCRAIRDREGGIPILMLSAKAGAEDRQAAAAAGASLYLTKPFKLSRLLTTVRKLVAGGQAVGSS
jgi:DNA-binding response OmpR family regulator